MLSLGAMLLLPPLLLAGIFSAMAVERCSILWLNHNSLSASLVPSEGSWRESNVSRPLLLLYCLICATLALISLALIPASERALVDSPNGVALWLLSIFLLVVIAGLFQYPFGSEAAIRLRHGLAVSTCLSAVLVSGPVALAAAAPAGSLQLSSIVLAQEGYWNLFWQPLGLALMLALGACTNIAMQNGFGGAFSARQFTRYSLLLCYSTLITTLFLGGYTGTALPGWLWLLAKTLIVMATLCMISHTARSIPLRHLFAFIWLIGFPFAALHLAVAALMPM